MTPEEILEVDAKRNHPPGTTAKDLIRLINGEIREGGDIIQEGDVLIVYRAIEPGVVEHHSFNADTPANLLKANEALWRMLKKVGVEIATTTYSNPKINSLLDTVRDEFDISITEQDGQFVAEVRL
jgi:hypothetical protein